LAQKSFRVTEKLRADIRAEFFNFPNHQSFALRLSF
jgi:hypothetical protein